MAAYAALVSVIHIIDNLELHPHPPISLHREQVELLTAKVDSLLEFLEAYNPNLGYNTEADPFESRVADAARKVEDVIESWVVHNITTHRKKISSSDVYDGLEKVIEEVSLIEKEALGIEGTMGVKYGQLGKPTPLDSSTTSSIMQKSAMVGADDVLLEMKSMLISDARKLQVIPIVGMGGTGKTTLALNIYQDRLMKEHFDICAWANISQEYSIHEILSQLTNEPSREVASELGEMLHKRLYCRKYLLIMDDMWSIEAWDGVRRFFPDNKNGSRIVVTTRLSNLASDLAGPKSLEMNILGEDDSWDLLSKTVFGKEGCPHELEEIGKKIGKSCKGLPLSLVVVGGLLAKSEQTKEFWEHIEENINAIVNSEDDERCLKILYTSYKQLPVHLKPCFLYMGVFPEDDEIRISRVVKLWVAEGFLKPISGKSLEEIAKGYLEDLIDRNLVLIHKTGSTGNIKRCKVHDLLRDLCRREATKERFYTTTPQGMVNGQRRLVVHRNKSKNEASDIDTSPLSMSLARSLIWEREHQTLPLLDSKLLRVLYSVKSLPIQKGPDLLRNMRQLVNSRFLDISVEQRCGFPLLVGLFWNLQTLVLHYWNYTAPSDFWYMPHIRHVRVQNLILPIPPKAHNDSIILGKLQSLAILKDFRCSKEEVRRIPNIKKLQIHNKEVVDDTYCLTNLDRLDKLESLKCKIYLQMNPWGRDPPRSLISFPRSLKKLSLEVDDSQCLDEMLGKIGVLPLLQKLKLYSGSFEKGRWETTEGQFRSLKFLLLGSCKGLIVWTADSSHFPCLKHLIVCYMDELEEIPLDFAEIPSLRVIEVDSCSDSCVVSARRILEEQEEFHGEEGALQVKVKLWIPNDKLQSLESANFRVESVYLKDINFGFLLNPE